MGMKLLPTVTVGDKKWVIRIMGQKLLPTATVGDKKDYASCAP